MYCIKCGKENDSSNKFCIGCGEPLKSILNSPSSVPSPSETTVIDQISSEDDSPWAKPETNNASNTNNQAADAAADSFSVEVVEDKTPTNNGLGSDSDTTVLGLTSLTLKSKDKEIIVDNLPATVGKGSAADCIVSGDEAISRVHIKIHEYGEDGFVIEDLDSTNKTYLNGNALDPGEQVVLNDGDKIKLGRTEFKVIL